MVTSQESAEIIIDMLMVALMKISKLLFTLFEMDDQSFLTPLTLSAREIIFFIAFQRETSQTSKIRREVHKMSI